MLYIIYLRRTIPILSFSNETSPVVSSNGYTDEELQNAMDQAGQNMIGIYSNLLPGSKAMFSDGNSMLFLDGGVFEGYFDKDNTSIKGTYVLTDSDDEYLANLNVYNESNMKYVQYKLLYDENKDFAIYLPESKRIIKLIY